MVTGNSRITIIGAGPAGCAAALAALSEGSAVTLYEKSRFPRHKVCGEFLSPEVVSAFQSLGLWSCFLAAGPAPITRAVLHFGPRPKRFALPEPAYSLSRYALEDPLLREAVLRGAELRVEDAKPGETPTVLARGRQAHARAGERLFGFKAHFQGPVDDAAELFFFRGCYVGVSSVEKCITNLCGLAPERLLRQRAGSVQLGTGCTSAGKASSKISRWNPGLLSNIDDDGASTGRSSYRHHCLKMVMSEIPWLWAYGTAHDARR